MPISVCQFYLLTLTESQSVVNSSHLSISFPYCMDLTVSPLLCCINQAPTLFFLQLLWVRNKQTVKVTLTAKTRLNEIMSYLLWLVVVRFHFTCPKCITKVFTATNECCTSGSCITAQHSL